MRWKELDRATLVVYNNKPLIFQMAVGPNKGPWT